MATAVLRVVQSIRGKSLQRERASSADRSLLEAFAQIGDEDAFAEIVRRHGPLVLGVCRRILGNAQDAEDAFQATFLVLARKAAKVAWHESIKNWLHGVACRIAMKARGQAIKRAQKEKAAAPASDASTPAVQWNELRGVLDEEIERLPIKYRDVLILCYLEGKTRDEAADLLGWSIGAVKGCLERGREVLRTRLCKRGLTLSAALCAGLLSDATVGAAQVSIPLQAATVSGAVHFAAGSAMQAGLAGPVLYLAQGALNAMLIAKIKTIGLMTLMLCFGTGAFLGVYHADSGGAANMSVTASAHGQEIPRRPAAEQEKDGKKKSGDFFGLIKAVDLKVGTLTVQSLRDGDREDVTFSLGAKNLKVESTFGQALKLTDLTPGLRVHLQLKEMDVMSVQVENPQVPAFLTKIDAEKRIVYGRAERMNAQYEVAADAKLTINGRAVKLAEVPLEERVFLTLTFDRKTVLAMNAKKVAGERPGVEKPREELPQDRRVERPVDRPGFVQGTIVDIDAAKNTVNVLVGRPEEQSIETVALAKGAKVHVQFAERSVAEISLAQLTKPLQAMIQLSDDKKSASSLIVLAPTLRGGVKSIDVAAKKITLVSEGRQEKTLDIDADAVIRVQARDAAKLADVTAGMNVIIGLSLDRQRVIGIVVQPPTRREGDR